MLAIPNINGGINVCHIIDSEATGQIVLVPHRTDLYRKEALVFLWILSIEPLTTSMQGIRKQSQDGEYTRKESK